MRNVNSLIQTDIKTQNKYSANKTSITEQVETGRYKCYNKILLYHSFDNRSILQLQNLETGVALAGQYSLAKFHQRIAKLQIKYK